MKFSTGSSSSSLASDSLSRKSTLCIYTDADFLNGPEKMDANSSGASSGCGVQEEVSSLKREVCTLHNALQLQSSTLAREQMRAGGLAARLVQRDGTQETRRIHADKQAASLLRALLVLEATLRREKSSIQQKLLVKDLQIQRQREEIEKLKSQRRTHCANCQQLIGFTSEQTNIETDPEFHSLDSVENHKFERCLSYHESQQQQPFQKNSRLVKSFQLSKKEVKTDNTSSSEEVFDGSDTVSTQCKNPFIKNKQAFVRKDATRRSRKYSLRKQNSLNSGASQKRIVSDGSVHSSSSAEDGGFSEKDTKNNEQLSDTITNDIQRASNRIDELLNNPQQYNSLDFGGNVKNRRRMSVGERMDDIHGIKKVTRVQEDLYKSLQQNKSGPVEKSENGNIDKLWYTNVSDPEQELEYGSKLKRDKINRSVSVNDILTSDTKNDDVFNKLSASSVELTTDKICKKSDKTELSNFEVEPNENWYASASDPDDEQSCEIYKNNPVLECVNQILLQNSLDENTSDGHRVYESPSPKASTKRVQFSTLNSISFDESVGKNGQNSNCPNNFLREFQNSGERRPPNKIVKFSLETASEHSYEVPITSEGFNYEVQSIYSNDYEPIVTLLHDVQNKNAVSRPVPLPRKINSLTKHDVNQKLSSVRSIAQNLENKMNGNHYIDMETTRFGSLPCALNKKKVPRVPPALPPKPKNLVSKFKLNSASNTNANSSQNSDSVGLTQRISDVHSVKTQSLSTKLNVKSSIPSEPDYCSISEINVPVVSSGMRGLISTQATVEIHTEKLTPNISEKRSTPKLATISKITPNKDIPKLPQVTEIIIPDDEDISEPPKIAMDTYPGKVHSIPNKLDFRKSIQIGHSVSTILSDIKNRNVPMEDVGKCIAANEITRNFPQKTITSPLKERRIVEKTTIDLPIFENDSEKFDDLSQNFEEFKIDDCEFTTAEEYRISSSDGGSTDENVESIEVSEEVDKMNDVLEAKNSIEGSYRIEFASENDLNAKNNLLNADPTKTITKSYSKMSNKPDLLSNIDTIETDSVRYSDIESSNSSSSNCGSYNTVKCEPATFLKEIDADAVKPEQNSKVPFEYFLESSGLCNKSILTPSRLQMKNVSKPKDVKMKSKASLTTVGRSTPFYDRLGSNTAIKYFEPYL